MIFLIFIILFLYLKKKKTTTTNNLGNKQKSNWDYAFFYSGGMKGVYKKSDVGKEETKIKTNLPTGADSSCGPSDKLAFSACITGKSSGKNKSSNCKGNAKGCYGIKYAGDKNSGYYLAENSGCKKSEQISLVNPNEKGKVASIEHGPFGTDLTGVLCSTKKWDKSLLKYGCTITPYLNSCPKFDDMALKLHTITQKNSKSKYLFTRKNDNGSTSCLIDVKLIYKIFGKNYFETPIKTSKSKKNGVAISWGHGVFDGGCGALTFMQQGPSQGSVKHKNPGHTNLHFQIGTRAWSGEWSDATNNEIDPTTKTILQWGNASGYLREGTNSDTALKGSLSCLQPRIRKIDLNKFYKLVNTICNSIKGGCKVTGCCVPGGNSQLSSCYGVQESDCKAQSKLNCPKNKDDTWCCKWVKRVGNAPCPNSATKWSCDKKSSKCVQQTISNNNKQWNTKKKCQQNCS